MEARPSPTPKGIPAAYSPDGGYHNHDRQHLPTADIATRALGELDRAVPVVTYCWGPGCDGATRAALALAQLGYRVKEMVGGIEYWTREGFGIQTSEGVRHSPPDPLTTPPGSISCAC